MMKIENTIVDQNNETKHLVIISGKGGTGKTTLTAAFAKLAEKVVVADCDVDAADLHLVLNPEYKESFTYRGGKKAVIDLKKCTECGLCSDHCRFNAIHQYQIDLLACEGCGFCYHICPENAVTMKEIISGYYHVGKFSEGHMVDAALEPGESNTGKLVTEVKNYSKSITQKNKSKWLLIDGPPGIGCPVNASLAGADFAIIVTEPTISGLNDLKRAIILIQRFHIQAVIVINKYDLNLNMTHLIERYANERNIKITGKIPFDETVDKTLLEEKSIIEIKENAVAQEIANIWQKICQGV